MQSNFGGVALPATEYKKIEDYQQQQFSMRSHNFSSDAKSCDQASDHGAVSNHIQHLHPYHPWIVVK